MVFTGVCTCYQVFGACNNHETVIFRSSYPKPSGLFYKMKHNTAKQMKPHQLTSSFVVRARVLSTIATAKVTTVVHKFFITEPGEKLRTGYRKFRVMQEARRRQLYNDDIRSSFPNMNIRV